MKHTLCSTSLFQSVNTVYPDWKSSGQDSRAKKISSASKSKVLRLLTQHTHATVDAELDKGPDLFETRQRGAHGLGTSSFLPWTRGSNLKGRLPQVQLWEGVIRRFTSAVDVLGETVNKTRSAHLLWKQRISRPAIMAVTYCNRKNRSNSSLYCISVSCVGGVQICICI